MNLWFCLFLSEGLRCAHVLALLGTGTRGNYTGRGLGASLYVRLPVRKGAQCLIYVVTDISISNWLLKWMNGRYAQVGTILDTRFSGSKKLPAPRKGKKGGGLGLLWLSFQWKRNEFAKGQNWNIPVYIFIPRQLLDDCSVFSRLIGWKTENIWRWIINPLTLGGAQMKMDLNWQVALLMPYFYMCEDKKKGIIVI